MIEHGNIRIRKKIQMRDLFDTLEEISKEFGEDYKIAYGSVDAEGYFIGPRKLQTEGTDVILGLNKLSSLRVHLGTRVGIIICRNMKGKITLLVIRKNNTVSEEDMDKIVEKIIEFTGGKFHASVRH